MKRAPFVKSLAAMSIAAALFLAAVLALNYAGYRWGYVDLAQHEKLRSVFAELESAGHRDIVFVGDSSLGRAIAEERASERLGRSVAVYSLTGAFGFAGSYNMARQALEKNSPSAIVVFQSILRFTGPESVPGYVLTERGLPDAGDIAWYQRLGMHLSLTNAVAVAGNIVDPPRREAGKGERAEKPEGGRKRGTERFRQLGWYRLSPRAIFPGKEAFLRRTGELCRAAGVECIYAHGPIYDRYCEGYENYLKAINEIVVDAGFRLLAPEPPCVPETEIDDSQDHIGWEFRDAYTDRYAAQLKAALAE